MNRLQRWHQSFVECPPAQTASSGRTTYGQSNCYRLALYPKAPTSPLRVRIRLTLPAPADSRSALPTRGEEVRHATPTLTN